MHTHVSAAQLRKSEFLSYFGQGQKDEVFCLSAFPTVRECAFNRQLVTQDASLHDAPMLLFRFLPPPITTPYLGVLLES